MNKLKTIRKMNKIEQVKLAKVMKKTQQNNQKRGPAYF